MNRINSYNVLWVFIITSLSVAATGNMLGQSKMPGGGANSLRKKEALEGAGLLSEDPNEFPFKIEGSRFVRKSDGKPVFLNIIGYQPLEPGQRPWLPSQTVDYKIREERVRDDLRRWRAYKGGTDPVVVRVYPQPNEEDPNGMPKVFYDGVREHGFWIIRDIYADQNLCDPNFIEKGCHKVDSVIKEVSDANALDLIFAWEIGNEFLPQDTPGWDADKIAKLIEAMCGYLKDKLDAPNFAGVSNWVTWASYPPYDPLYTDGNPLEPNCLDYISYNAYSYWPEHICDHQAGAATGTPYQGYLAALKNCYPNKPLVISETGLSDSNQAIIQGRHHPWYPSYRYGGMSPEQVAEGLADRYWDAYLLNDENDANMVIAGITIFEWNDEWWKGGTPGVDDQLPEEHFGLGRFEERPGGGRYQLRYKLQQETIRDLYTLKFDSNTPIIESLTADTNTLPVDANTWVRAVISDVAAQPVRLRWEASRGYIVGDPNDMWDPNKLGDPNKVKFYAGKVALGPAKITVIAVDANGNANTASTSINIEISEPNRIEILTVGPGLETGRASGRVYNVNLDKYKLVCYLLLNWTPELWAKPYFDMKSIWVDKEGYWWTPVQRHPDEELFCWLVRVDYDPPNKVQFPPEPNWPPGHIAEANTVGMDPNDYNDVDNDLLLDRWEREHFTNINKYDRYDDPDGDMGNNLEEFLRGLDPNDANDDDKDGLRDNWEYHFFGDVNFFDANDDPDGDRLKNWQERNPDVGTHPARASQDEDRDGLADTWEMRWFGNLSQDANENFDGDCFNNLDEYELSLDPTSRMADLDLNCEINLVDYSLFALHWGESDCNELNNWCGWADLDENGEINLADLYLLTENWLRRLY